MKYASTITFLIAICLLTFSQEQSFPFSFDFEIRQRYEQWDGMNARNYGDKDGPGSLSDQILLQRIISGFRYTPSNSLIIVFHLQDSRAFGWSLQHQKDPSIFKNPSTGIVMNPNEQFFEIYDLYVSYQKMGSNANMSLGRQKINYGDNRIFGPGSWGNTGRWTWDALKISYQRDEGFIDLFAGGTKTHNPVKTSIPFTHTQFWGGGMYARHVFHDILITEPFYAVKTRGSADILSEQSFIRHWTGIRLLNRKNPLRYDITYAHQLGHNNNTPINAFGIVAKLAFQFDGMPGKPLIGLRESYASGGTTEDDVIRTFEPAYGARDRYYGRMNICSWSNIDNREILLELFPIENMWIQFQYHRLYIPSPDDLVLLNTMQLQSGEYHLGDELNLFITYRLENQIEITASAGYFLAGQLEPINRESPKNASFFGLQLFYEL